MAKHKFGIMPIDPKHGQRHDEYEPEKYGCISVDDEHIEGILPRLATIDFYWHSLDVPGKGLAYTGITIIPPSSMDKIINAIQDYLALNELNALLMKAKAKSKYIIHFGI